MRQIFAALVLSTLAPPAGAEGRSALAEVVLAQDMFAYGREAGDVLAMIAAAGIMARTPLRDVPGAQATTGTPPPDATAMLDTARAQAADNEVWLGLIEDIAARSSRGLTGGPAKAQRDLAEGAEDLFTLKFEAGKFAELAVVGGGTADLDLVITAADGTEVCADRRFSGRLYCGWLPDVSDEFSVLVLNQGAGADTYWFLTN